jgi:transcriptional regulator with XRE-family HTH domain
MSELGLRIQRARQGAGLTQKELGARLGCESITVSRWERGVTSPSLRTLERVSVITKVPLSDFVVGDGAPNVILDELRLLRELVEKIEQKLNSLRVGKP